MLRKEIHYTDYNGKTQKDLAYFNMNKAELGKLQMRENGTYIDRLQDLVARRKVEEMFNFVYNLILDSYGERDPEGRKFIKNEQLRSDFEQSIAFSEFLMELVADGNKLSEFITAILPPDMVTGEGSLNAQALPPAN